MIRRAQWKENEPVGKVSLELKYVSPDLMGAQWRMWFYYEKVYLRSRILSCSWKKKAIVIMELHLWVSCSHIIPVQTVLSCTKFSRQSCFPTTRVLTLAAGSASVITPVLVWICSPTVFTISSCVCLCCLNVCVLCCSGMRCFTAD